MIFYLPVNILFCNLLVDELYVKHSLNGAKPTQTHQ